MSLFNRKQISGIFLLIVCLFKWISCEDPDFFLNAAKSVPRIGRTSNSNSKNNAEFEKFFLKASKSVPRIGRRNEVPMNQDYDLEIPSDKISYPKWSEIADRFEQEPELFIYPDHLSKLEEALGDDPTVYEWNKVRIKRKIPARFTFAKAS